MIITSLPPAPLNIVPPPASLNTVLHLLENLEELLAGDGPIIVSIEYLEYFSILLDLNTGELVSVKGVTSSRAGSDWVKIKHH